MRRLGFSLTETIVAIGIVACLFFTVAEMIPNGLILSKARERQLNGERIARMALEGQSAQLWAAPTSSLLPAQTQGGIVYSIQLDPFAPPQSDPQSLRGLRVTVTWSYAGKRFQVVRELLIHHLVS